MAGPYGPAVRDALLETLFASGSNLLLLPVQDVFGWRDRINEPATVNELQLDLQAAVAVDRLHEVPEARERQARLRSWSAEARTHIIQAMATLRPFRALRPTPRGRLAIAAVPYDVVNADEARALADRQPSQLSPRLAGGARAAARHRTRTPTTSTTGPSRISNLAEGSSLVVEDEPSVYLYRLSDAALTSRPAWPAAIRSTSTTAA